MSSRRAAGVLALVASFAALVGCGSSSGGQAGASALTDDAITVGSFDFGESEVLAEIYSQALEHGGYHVERAFNLGPRELVSPALSQGLIELVPEYAGTGVDFLSLGASAPSADEAATHDALVAALDGNDVEALAAAPAQDANTFVVTRATADRFGLQAISDLRAVAPELTFGGPPECPTRPRCLAGLQRVYGLRFADLVRLDAGGPMTHQALGSGAVDVALLFSSDPALVDTDLVELRDDRGLQPAENVTPLVRTEVVQRWGDDLVATIDAVSRHLTTDDLRALNGAIGAEGASLHEVAHDWLEQAGLM